MPDNETNEDNANKRPKRRATQRTYMSYEITNEDKDLKRALLASLQDVKKTVPKSSSVFQQNGKNESNTEKKNNKSDVFPKVNPKNSSQSNVCKESQSLVADNNCSLLSLAAHRRARVSAQRKFAQSSGFTTNSPISTPIKTGFVASTNVVDLFPNQKPKTEDFLTFLCLRRSSILPPNLDFIRIESEQKGVEEKKQFPNDSENISNDESEANDKYTTCRLRASVDRRGSSSSTVSKATSLSSRASLQVSNRKKSENQRNENKIQNTKRIQSSNHENGVKNIGTDLKTNVRQSLQNLKNNSSKLKSFDSLKEKYKQQRIDKKTSIPSKTLNSNKKIDSKDIKVNNFKDKKKSETIGIQTRQQSRNHSKNGREFESKEKSFTKNSSSGRSERILRSNKSIIVCHNNSDSDVQKTTKSSLLQKTNSKKSSFNSSHIGIRPKKRKARPVVPLIDYYFDSEFESDFEKKNIKSEDNSSQEIKAKNLKNISKDNKNKKISKVISEELRNTSNRSKGTNKSMNKSKTNLSSDSRRLTRSSRPLSPQKDEKELERERLLREKMIAIEKKHKRLRRCPSNQSLHSSTSSSSSSSESLPNSLSSSSSINNTRLTRSLEHLKKIRDIAAKLKREHNKKKDKNKTIPKNTANNRKNKQNVNKRKNSSEIKIEKSFDKNRKTNKTKKTIIESTQRTVTRSMRDSVVRAMSDTDCDTEGNDCQDCEHMLSDLSATEDSIASILDEDMERASNVIQDMAEDINSLLVNSSENDLQYGSTEHIQGLMTCEFSGAFSEETVTTASAILLPSDCHSEYSYRDDSQMRSTVDASTNTTEEDILSSLSSDEIQTDLQYEYISQTTTVGTQTTVNSSVQTDGSLE